SPFTGSTTASTTASRAASPQPPTWFAPQHTLVPQPSNDRCRTRGSTFTSTVPASAVTVGRGSSVPPVVVPAPPAPPADVPWRVPEFVILALVALTPPAPEAVALALAEPPPV